MGTAEVRPRELLAHKPLDIGSKLFNLLRFRTATPEPGEPYNMPEQYHASKSQFKRRLHQIGALAQSMSVDQRERAHLAVDRPCGWGRPDAGLELKPTASFVTVDETDIKTGAIHISKDGHKTRFRISVKSVDSAENDFEINYPPQTTADRQIPADADELVRVMSERMTEAVQVQKQAS